MLHSIALDRLHLDPRVPKKQLHDRQRADMEVVDRDRTLPDLLLRKDFRGTESRRDTGRNLQNQGTVLMLVGVSKTLGGVMILEIHPPSRDTHRAQTR